MTTREIFFKIALSVDLPVGIAYYIFKTTTDGDPNWISYTPANREEKIEFGEIFLDFHEDKREESINKMMKIEKEQKGFMFWASSPEGEEFIKKHALEIGQAFYRSHTKFE